MDLMEALAMMAVLLADLMPVTRDELTERVAMRSVISAMALTEALLLQRYAGAAT
jgi:hypothetical protein